MLRFMDGFDHYASGHVETKWTLKSGNMIGMSGWGRNGTQGALMERGSSHLRKTLDSQGTWIIGVAFRKTATQAVDMGILGLWDNGSAQLDVRRIVAGNVVLTRNGTVLATSAETLTEGAWYYVELKAVIGDAGSAIVRVNGIEVINFSGDTQATANATADQVSAGGGGSGSDGFHAFDDFYACDGQGTENNDFLGDVKVETLVPTGAGNYTEFDPSAGSNWQNVDDAPPDDDSTYNGSSTVGERDSFVMADLATISGSVKGIQQVTRWRKDDAGSRTGKQFLRIGGTDYDEAVASSISDSYTYKYRLLEENPDTSAPFTIADINGLEAGYKVES